jgi:moderate conductance mechanosensitive channel
MRAMVSAIAPITDVTGWLRSSGLEIVLFVTGAILLSRFVRWLGEWITARIDAESDDSPGLVREEASKHRHVVSQVITWTVVVLIYCVAAVLVVQRLGVPLTGLVAPATVVGVALGFGAQRIVQDVLAGLFIIAERQYGFGDVIRISQLGSTTGVNGTVEAVTLRVTRLRSLNGEVVIVPNGQIVQVTNQSRDWARSVVDVPVPATADINHVTDILRAAGADLYADEDLRPVLLDAPSVMGVESIEVDRLHIRIVARTLPGRQFEVGRELRARIAVAFQAEGIHLPADLDTAEPSGAG